MPDGRGRDPARRSGCATRHVAINKVARRASPAASSANRRAGANCPLLHMRQPVILITGSLTEGFKFYGPFATPAAATEFAKAPPDLNESEWWLAPLHSHKDDEFVAVFVADQPLSHGFPPRGSDRQPVILITGGPSEGFKFYGPFAGPPDLNDREWWLAPLHSHKDDDK